MTNRQSAWTGMLPVDDTALYVSDVLATGDNLGSQDGEMEQGRAVLDPILASNPNIKVSAKVASNHSKILRNDSPAVATAVRELTASGHAIS